MVVDMRNKATILLLATALFSFQWSFSQQPLTSEIQVNFNTYSDNFKVNVVYPSLSATTKLSKATRITGKYLVDAISAASMKSRFEVDGVSSATTSLAGGGDDEPDELRHEIGAGITQDVADARLSVSGLWSTEHDYQSKTFIGNVSYPFAQQNTTLKIGVTRSWDDIFPQTKDWTKTKDVASFDASVSQVVSTKALAQFSAYYSRNRGLLSQPYNIVQFIESGELRTVDPIHPSTRNRHAMSARGIVMPGLRSSVEVGYRFYWDSWDIQSHTIHLVGKRYNRLRDIRITMGGRWYVQDKASFFKPDYDGSEKYMTVDGQLDKSYSQEYGIRVSILGQWFKDKALLQHVLNNSGSDISLAAKLYHRHTNTRNWHSRRRDLLALLLGVGVKFGF